MKVLLAVDRVFTEGAPAEEVLPATERQPADLIVMGSKGLTGLDRYPLGKRLSESRVALPCLVLVVKSRG